MNIAILTFLLFTVALSTVSAQQCPLPQEIMPNCAVAARRPLPGQVSGIAAFEYKRTSRNGPSNWHRLNCRTGRFAKFSGCSYCKNICSGKSQSPIDIIRRQARRAPSVGAPRVTLAGNAVVEYMVTPSNFELLCRKKETCGSTVFRNKRYYVENVHMHHRSEHLLDAKQYPLEMHFVHKNKEDVLVLAIFFRLGRFNSELEKFLQIAKKKCFGSINLRKLVQPAVAPNKLMTYSGSLTTPPCTEGIRFIVSQRLLTASNSQIAEFNDLIANQMDSRPRQPLNGRKVTLFT